MTLDEYQKLALTTAGPDCKGSKVYSMGGVGGEAGEYIDVVKKHLFHGISEEKSREEALKELGDLLWGVAQAADAWGFTLEDVADRNLSKLRARYPNGFSTAASQARVDQHTQALPAANHYCDSLSPCIEHGCNSRSCFCACPVSVGADCWKENPCRAHGCASDDCRCPV
jgi:NTP pyrophosphatase (non-canonical NTP hydrolase)